MTDAIMEVLAWVNYWINGLSANGSPLTGSLSSFMPDLYHYSNEIMTDVCLPVAYTVLAFFMVMEIYKIAVRAESMGTTGTMGVEAVFKAIVKLSLCKIAVESTALIMNAIYSASTYLTNGVAGILGRETMGEGIALDTIQPIVDALGFCSKLIVLILCFVAFLVIFLAVVFANIIVIARFIELYAYFAVSPIPIATIPHEELSQIGKNFLKSFAAVSIQGMLLFMVLSFFPVIFNSGFLSTDGTDFYALLAQLSAILGYAIVLVLAVFMSGRWARSICSAA